MTFGYVVYTLDAKTKTVVGERVGDRVLNSETNERGVSFLCQKEGGCCGWVQSERQSGFVSLLITLQEGACLAMNV